VAQYSICTIALVRSVNVLCLSLLGFCDLLVDISSIGVMFLPQQPFLITGSLAEQVKNLVCSPCIFRVYKLRLRVYRSLYNACKKNIRTIN